MREINGIQFFEADEKPPGIPDHLRNLEMPIHAPYGFKLVEIDGTTLWQAADESDFRQLISKLLNKPQETLSKEDITAVWRCRMRAPDNCDPFSCNSPQTSCELSVDQDSRLYVCLCQSW